MKNIFKRSIPAVIVICISIVSVSWGIWGHQHINRAAVFALPEEMRVFFYNHIDFVTEESNVPDLRKYAINDKAEFPRHYIDLEDYFVTGSVDSLPKTMKEAKAKYPDTILNKSGILPWYLQEMMEKLTVAFKNKRKTEILFLAADLGHYIGDSYMPLHLCSNHNGQFTGQKGIHAFWEAQLPEQFGDEYDFNTGNAVYIPDIQKEVFRMIEANHKLADILLLTEKKLSSEFPQDNIYEKDSTGNIRKNKFGQPIHSFAYAKKYHELLGGMVEKQMRGAVATTANFWYTAWVNAGKPDLNDMDAKDLTERNKANYDKEVELWKKGKLVKLRIDNEF